MKPSLSVLLLCWNHRAYLSDCIEALARQSDQEFEIVMLDNLSTDGSAEFAEEQFRKHGLTARVVVNDAPRSIPINYNKLFSMASGSLITFLSTDDYYAPDYVATMRAAAEAHPEAGWLSCGGWLLDGISGALSEVDLRAFDTRGDIRAALLAGLEPFFYVGICYRRAMLEEVGGFAEDVPIEDADLFFRLAGRSPHHIVPAPLLIRRDHGASASSDPLFMVDALEKFYAKHRDSFPGRLLGDRRSEMMRLYAASHADRGEGKAAVRLSLRALAMRPLDRMKWRTLVYALRTAATGARRA